MDLNLLYVFAAVYRERNLSRAAESLGMSPPGVSAALRRLREEFQDTLFIRKPHGVEPTVRADAIAEKFGLALNLVEQAKKPEGVFDPLEGNRTFIIGMSDYSQAIILPALLAVLRASAPGVSLAIRHTGNEGVRQSLEDGSFDLLIGNVYAPLGRIRQQQLLSERFIGVVANTHPLASGEFSMAELNKYPALLTEGHGNDRWWEHQLVKSTGFVPTKVISIPGFLGVSLLLLNSPLVCVTARRLSKIFTNSYPVKEIPLPFSDQVIAVRQYWHERWQSDPGHTWLRQAIHAVCQKV